MAETRYVWDYASDSYLMEKDETGATRAVYTNEPVQYGSLVSQRREGATSWYHFDGQGSTRELTDQVEAVSDEYANSAFGTDVVSSAATPNTFVVGGGVGYYRDQAVETLQVRARDLAPLRGRWISRDPLEVDGNGYWYVSNGPVNLMDPSGLKAPRSRPIHIQFNDPVALPLKSGVLCRIELVCWPAFHAIAGQQTVHCQWRIYPYYVKYPHECRGELKRCPTTSCWSGNCIGLTLTILNTAPKKGKVVFTYESTSLSMCDCMVQQCARHSYWNTCYDVLPEGGVKRDGNSNTAAYCLGVMCGMPIGGSPTVSVGLTATGWGIGNCPVVASRPIVPVYQYDPADFDVNGDWIGQR